MEERKLYLLAYYFDAVSDEPNCPYPPLEVNIVIEKDNLTNKFHFIDFGIEYDHWRKETVFETFEDALDYFYTYQLWFFLFEIKELDTGKKFIYTKKLIEKLNAEQYKEFDKIPVESFKKHLGIDVFLVKDAKKSGVRIINMVKNQNTNNETKSFFVGKLGIEGSNVIIKDENDQIILLTSMDNLTIETQEIKEEYYWCFKK